MKIIHTADWHIGQTFFGYDRSEEHQAFLDWLTAETESSGVDVLLICGDVFDVANPSAHAQRQFYRFLRTVTEKNPGLQIIVIAGNHDSAARLESPIPLLEDRNIHIRGVVKRKENGEIDADHLIIRLYNRKGQPAGWCMAVPYLRQGDYPISNEDENDPYYAGVKSLYTLLLNRIQELASPEEAIIAMGHLQTAGCALSEDDHSERLIIGGLEGLPADVFGTEITYTALGHIHREQQAGGKKEIHYAGSPLPMSFAEENYRHGVMLIETADKKIIRQEKICFTPLRQLMRIPRQPLPLHDVLEELAKLPAENPEQPAPYVEVRVLLSEPEPSLRNRVEEAIIGKQARLTRVLPYYPVSDETNQTTDFISTEELMDPWKMMQLIYEKKYQTDLPETLTHIFKEVLEESHLKLGDI